MKTKKKEEKKMTQPKGGRTRAATTGRGGRDEIDEMKKLMEDELGHTVRVGMVKDKGSMEVAEKMRVMEEELGQPIQVRRGTQTKKKGSTQDEIQRKKEMMEIILGEEVVVQQLLIEDK